MNDKIYIALEVSKQLQYEEGPGRDGHLEFMSTIYAISTADFSSWKNVTTLYLVDCTLATYHSKLVLIGGRMELYQLFWEVRDSLLVSSGGVNWHPSLPPMPTKRYQATAVNTGSPEYLVVAGGRGISDEVLVSVEVLVEDQWSVIEPLPFPYCGVRYCFHNGNLILTVGEDDEPQGVMWRHMYCKLESLVVACTQSPTTALESRSTLWKQYLSNETQFTSFGGLLFCSCHGQMLVHSPTAQSWVHVDEPSFDIRSLALALAPTGELVVITSKTDYTDDSHTDYYDLCKATIKGKKYWKIPH